MAQATTEVERDAEGQELEAQEQMDQHHEEEGKFQMGLDPTQETTSATQDEAEDGEGEEDGEPDTEEGEPFSQQKTKKARRAENAQEKMVKLAGASARLPYEIPQQQKRLIPIDYGKQFLS